MPTPPVTLLTGRPPRRAGRPARWQLLAVAVTVALASGALVVGLGGLAQAQPLPPSTAPPTAPAPTTPPTQPLPQPPTTTPPPAPLTPPPTASPPPTTQPAPGPGADDPSFWDLPGQVRKAINDWITGLVLDGLNPLLDLLGQSLLSSSDAVVGDRVGQLWTSTQVAANTLYVLIVMIGGIVLMTHETLQTRYAVKQIGPRLVVGFLASNLSLLLVRQVVPLSNALATAVTGGGLNPDEVRDTLRTLLLGSLSNGGVFLALIGLIAVAMLLALLATHVFCTAVLVLLVAAGPLMLSCHGLPHTEAIATMWWRLTGAMLAVPVVQAVALMAAVRTFLAPGGFTWFGLPTGNGLVNLLVTCTLLYLLVRVPFWLCRAAIGGHSRSTLAAIVKGVLIYKTLGALGVVGSRGRGGGHRGPGPRPAGGPTGGNPPAGGSTDGGGGGGGGPRPVPPRPTLGGARRAPTTPGRPSAVQSRTARTARPRPTARRPGAVGATHGPASHGQPTYAATTRPVAGPTPSATGPRLAASPPPTTRAAGTTARAAAPAPSPVPARATGMRLPAVAAHPATHHPAAPPAGSRGSASPSTPPPGNPARAARATQLRLPLDLGRRPRPVQYRLPLDLPPRRPATPPATTQATPEHPHKPPRPDQREVSP